MASLERKKQNSKAWIMTNAVNLLKFENECGLGASPLTARTSNPASAHYPYWHLWHSLLWHPSYFINDVWCSQVLFFYSAKKLGCSLFYISTFHYYASSTPWPLTFWIQTTSAFFRLSTTVAFFYPRVCDMGGLPLTVALPQNPRYLASSFFLSFFLSFFHSCRAPCLGCRHW